MKIGGTRNKRRKDNRWRKRVLDWIPGSIKHSKKILDRRWGEEIESLSCRDIYE